jgi:hypothetical protein
MQVDRPAAGLAMHAHVEGANTPNFPNEPCVLAHSGEIHPSAQRDVRKMRRSHPANFHSLAEPCMVSLGMNRPPAWNVIMPL